MSSNQTVKYEYKCPFCKKYFMVDESESFLERECPLCHETVIPEPPGMNKGPLIKLHLNVHQRRLLAVVLGYTFGVFGAHKFVLNYNGTGTLYLLITLILATIYLPLVLIVLIIAILESTIYLLTPDEKFEQRYITNQHHFF